jgi:hypothetical protein
LDGATHFLTRTLGRVSTEKSLQVLAYHLRRVVNILGVAGPMKAMKMATCGGPEGLLTAAIFDWHKLDAPNLIDPTGDVALGGGNGYPRPRRGNRYV